MSAYFQSLGAVARVRCQEKLTLLGLSVSEDPYELWSKEKFVESMSCGLQLSTAIFSVISYFY